MASKSKLKEVIINSDNYYEICFSVTDKWEVEDILDFVESEYPGIKGVEMAIYELS